jgi:putative transcriptional regulator
MTVSPTHHPGAPLLSAAASGALSPAVSRIIAAHAALCGHCRAELRRLESIGGAVLADEGAVELAPDALDRALAALDRKVPEPVLPDALTLLPKPVHELIAPAIGQVGWRFGAPGLRILDLALPAAAAGEVFQLLRIEPGSGVPQHGHGGQEFTLVLTGAFRDETGLYRMGDLEVGDEAMTHRPIAEPGEICYALAVTTAPLKFKGPLGLLQRVFNLGRS